MLLVALIFDWCSIVFTVEEEASIKSHAEMFREESAEI